MRVKNPILKNQNGMTMVEVIVTMGIALVLIMGVMQMSNYANKAAKNVQTSSEWSLMATQAQLLLQQEIHCQASLQGLTLNPSAPTSLPQGLRFFMNGTDTPVTVAKVDKYGGYSIDSVTLKTTGAPSTIKTANGDQTLYAATLEISGKKLGQSIGGANLKTLSIPLQVVTNPLTNAIVGCYGKDLASAQACTDLGGQYIPALPPAPAKCQGTGGFQKCRRIENLGCDTGGSVDNAPRSLMCKATCAADEMAISAGGSCLAIERHGAIIGDGSWESWPEYARIYELKTRGTAETGGAEEAYIHCYNDKSKWRTTAKVWGICCPK